MYINWKLTGVIAAITIIVTYIMVKRTTAIQNGQYKLKQKKKMHNRFVFYSNNIFLRKRFKRIVTQVSTMSCFTHDEVEKESVKMFEKAFYCSVAMPIAGAILFQDVIFGLLMCLVALIFYTLTVDNVIDKINVKIINQLSESVSSISEMYLQYENIQLAVLYCDKGKYVSKSINKIYEIITAVNSEDRLYEFCRTMPVRMTRTLAITCYIMNEIGDEKTENGGSSFVEVLTMLREELDAEVRRIQDTKLAFKSLPWLSLTGLAVAPIIDKFLLSFLPGTAMYVKGLYGSIEKTVLILLTMFAYHRISTYSRASTVNQTDRIEFINKLSKNKKVKGFIKNVMPKKFKTNMKLARLMRDSITSKTKEYIYTLKVFMSVTGFVVTLLVLACFTISAKSFIWNYYYTLDMTSMNNDMTEARYNQIKKLDRVYMTKDEKMDKEEATKLVRSYVKGIKAYDADLQANRLSKKWDVYYGLHYKWYYILLAYVVAVICWFAPEISLRLRKKLVSYEAAEDSAQIQNIMIVLAKTNTDVLKSLYWMEKISVIHKVPLRFAYHEYTSDPEGALMRLKSSVETVELKRVVSKLSTAIYSLSMRESFNDIILDKRQSLLLRERLRLEVINSKKNSAKMLASYMLLISIIAGMIAPLVILGVTNLVQSFSTIG